MADRKRDKRRRRPAARRNGAAADGARKDARAADGAADGAREDGVAADAAASVDGAREDAVAADGAASVDGAEGVASDGAAEVAQPESVAADGAQAEPDELTQPLVRGDLPGSLDHSSGADDEFDAALVAGARGETVSERELERAVRESERRTGERRPAVAEERHGNRVIGFLKACWAELQRVQWPDRRHVGQATAVVVGFVALASAYLGLADLVAKEIVEKIL